MNVRLGILAAVAALLAGGGADAASIVLSDVDSGLTSPAGNYRWLNVADQPYAAGYRSAYNYTQASVQVSYDSVATVFRGSLVATNLKPNFAYQFKLVGTPGTAANERIGLAGRWWQEEWDCASSSWVNGQNLNNKGNGSSPNPNDADYLLRHSIPGASPTGFLYKYTGYVLFDYFVTNDCGNAAFPFWADSSYHVIWKTSQATQHAWTALDGPVETASFDPVASNLAYRADLPPASEGVFGEWERLPVGGLSPGYGSYACQVLLTEESFHGSGGVDAGGWAAAMAGSIAFVITHPGDATGDGKVDGADLAVWQQNYDPRGLDSGNDFASGDWNGDGRIDGGDLALWQQNYDPVGSAGWGAVGQDSVPTSAIPEPAALSAAALGAFALRLLLRRRKSEVGARRGSRTLNPFGTGS